MEKRPRPSLQRRAARLGTGSGSGRSTRRILERRFSHGLIAVDWPWRRMLILHRVRTVGSPDERNVRGRVRVQGYKGRPPVLPVGIDRARCLILRRDGGGDAKLLTRGSAGEGSVAVCVVEPIRKSRVANHRGRDNCRIVCGTSDGGADAVEVVVTLSDTGRTSCGMRIKRTRRERHGPQQSCGRSACRAREGLRRSRSWRIGRAQKAIVLVARSVKIIDTELHTIPHLGLRHPLSKGDQRSLPERSTGAYNTKALCNVPLSHQHYRVRGRML